MLFSILFGIIYLHESTATLSRYDEATQQYSGSSTLFVLGTLCICIGMLTMYYREVQQRQDHSELNQYRARDVEQQQQQQKQPPKETDRLLG